MAHHPRWLLLGEASSKTDHVRRALLRPEVAKQLLDVFLVKGAVATTAIEGNTLSEEEALQVMEETLKLPPSKAYLGQEIKNIIGAFNRIRDDVFESRGQLPLSVDTIKDYNAMVLEGLEVDDHVVPGEIREASVVVGPYRGAPARECEYLLERLCDWLNSGAFDAPEGQPELQAPLTIIKAVLAHLYLTWIHPFGDGNGRTARLLELHILLASGFATPVTQLLSNHYNRTRSDYYRQLGNASRTNDPHGFLLYAVQGFVDELRSQLDRIWAMQYEDRWEQYVHQRFGHARTETEQRRLRLVKDLSKASIQRNDEHPLPNLDPVPRARIRELSPGLAVAYSTKTDRTLTRDLNALVEMGMIDREGGGYVPASDDVLGFMPPYAGERPIW